MKRKGRGFPLEYYPGEILTEKEAAINRKMFLFRVTGMGGALPTNVLVMLPPPPIAMVLNRGLGDYPLTNHIGTFERRPEICKYNPYISNYLAKPGQIEDFDASNSSSITYQDLVGNSHTNIGPVFGKTASSILTPTVNDVDSEL